MVSNTLINARAHPGGFYLQTKKPRIYRVCLSYYCEEEGKNAMNSVKKIDVWLQELLTIEISLGSVV